MAYVVLGGAGFLGSFYVMHSYKKGLMLYA